MKKELRYKAAAVGLIALTALLVAASVGLSAAGWQTVGVMCGIAAVATAAAAQWILT